MDVLTGQTLTDDAVEAAKQAVFAAIDPLDDPITPPAYRRHVAGVLVQRLLVRIRERLA